MMVGLKSDLCKDFGGIVLVCERCEFYVIYCYYIYVIICVFNGDDENFGFFFYLFQVFVSSESMYDDVYILQYVFYEDVYNFNYVVGMVFFLFNFI